MQTASINPKCRIHGCVSKDESRPPLLNVALMELDGKPSAVATDGRKAVVIPVNVDLKEHNTHEKAIQLKPEVFTQSFKQRGDLKGIFQLNENKAIIPQSGTEIPYDTESRYPNITQILPDKKDYDKDPAIVLSAELLQDIQKAFGSSGVKIFIRKDEKGQYDPSYPLRVTPINGSPEPDAHAVLMPMRDC